MTYFYHLHIDYLCILAAPSGMFLIANQKQAQALKCLAPTTFPSVRERPFARTHTV